MSIEPDLPPRIPIIRVGVAFEGALGVIAWLLGWVLHQPPFNAFRWSTTDGALGLAATAPMLLIFVACLRWPVGPLARIKQISEEFIRPLFVRCSLGGLLLLSVAAGLCEELLFRGFMQPYFARHLGFWAGLVLASVVFGLLHLITPTYAVLAAALGLYLGYCFAATDNLLTVVVAHTVYDFVALVYLLREPMSQSDEGGC